MLKTYLETLRDWGLSVEEEDLFLPLSSVTKHANVQDFFECPHTFSEDTNFSHADVSRKGHRLIYWNLCDLTHPKLIGATKAAETAAREAFWAVYLAEVLRAFDSQMEWEIRALGLVPSTHSLTKEFLEYTPKATDDSRFIEIGQRFGVANIFDAVRARRLENLSKYIPGLKQLVLEVFGLGELTKGEPSAYVNFKGVTPLLKEILETIYPSATMSESDSWPGRPQTFYLVPLKADWEFINEKQKLFDTATSSFFKDDETGAAYSRRRSLLTQSVLNFCGPVKGYLSPSCAPEFTETVKVLANEMNFEQALKSALALTS